eukprot:10246622-Lingulodinium_polyedra.AAC.1
MENPSPGRALNVMDNTHVAGTLAGRIKGLVTEAALVETGGLHSTGRVSKAGMAAGVRGMDASTDGA